MSTRTHPCQVCQHLSRDAIDQAIVNGKSHRAVARDFGIGSGTPGTETFKPDHKKVARHVEQCMGEAFRASKAAAQEASGDALVARMRELDAAVDEVLERTRAGKVVTDEHGPVLDPETGQPLRVYMDSTLLAAVREARRNTELRARLGGAMSADEAAQVELMRRGLEQPGVRAQVAALEQALMRSETPGGPA